MNSLQISGFTIPSSTFPKRNSLLSGTLTLASAGFFSRFLGFFFRVFLSHYISEGLLTPLRVNTQYNFSEIDDRVMESILLLKSMNFKLEEMKPYLLFQTMYTNNAFSYMGSFKKEFEEKLEENRREIQRLTKMNELIEKKIDGYQKIEFQRGVSLRSLLELTCPDCEEGLELSASEILHNEIMEGDLVCPKCGRTYYIRYGILSDELIEDF